MDTGKTMPRTNTDRSAGVAKEAAAGASTNATTPPKSTASVSKDKSGTFTTISASALDGLKNLLRNKASTDAEEQLQKHGKRLEQASKVDEHQANHKKSTPGSQGR